MEKLELIKNSEEMRNRIKPKYTSGVKFEGEVFVFHFNDPKFLDYINLIIFKK